MSTLDAVIAALANLAVPYQTVSLTARYGATTPLSVADADLPVRIIPIVAGVRATAYETHTLTGTASVLWEIDDLLLAQVVGLDTGLDAVSGSLAAYVDDYMRRVRALRAPRHMLQRVTAQIGVVQYPAGSERAYYGVRVTVSIATLLETV
jgi:hypothetical protein